jgi:hypothetical protein
MLVRPLTAVCVFIALAACASPQKRQQNSSAVRDRFDRPDREEPVPRPLLRNRYTGQPQNEAGMRIRPGQTAQARNVVAVVKTSRLIDMRYMLDLFEHNSKAKVVSEILDKRDSNIRECYSDRVASAPGLKGTITFGFRLSRRTPGLHAIQRTGGSINDAFLESCIAAELQRIPLATYVSGRGELRYSFNVVNERQQVDTVFGTTR